MNIEHKYIDMISSSLIGFKRRDSSFIFTCPYCQNQAKYQKTKHLPSSKLKGSFYWKHGPIKFKCHKCGTAREFHQFLQDHFSNYFLSYAAEISAPWSRWQQYKPQPVNPFSKRVQQRCSANHGAQEADQSVTAASKATEAEIDEPQVIRYCRRTRQQQAGLGSVLDQKTARPKKSWSERQADLWLSTDCWHIEEIN